LADIICDTNIWYNIGNGLIREEDILDKPLSMHWLSLGELVSTNKSFTNPELLRNAALSAIKGNRKLYHYPPLNHIAYLFDQSNVFEANMQLGLAALILQLNNPAQSAEREINYDAKKKNIEIKKDLVEKTNANSINLKKKIKNKKQYMNADNIDAVRKFIVDEVNNYFKKELFDTKLFDWKKLELYEGAMKMLSKMLVVGQTKLTQNDLVDIFQLVYVQPGNLFWTRDKKLKEIIKMASLEHYLYEK
jgi:hypothetical protein